MLGKVGVNKQYGNGMTDNSNRSLNLPEDEGESKSSTWDTEDEQHASKFSWEPEKAELHELYNKSLRELIKVGYSAGEETRTGVRSFPVGLLSWWRDVIAEEGDISLSKLQRITINHGMSIASYDQRIKEVMKLYRNKIRQARDTKDKQLIKLLEEKGGALNFISEVKYPTSVGLMKWAEGPVSAISAALGIPITKLIIYLSLMSMMTLEPCGWKEMLREDIELFWKYVDQRAKALK